MPTSISKEKKQLETQRLVALLSFHAILTTLFHGSISHLLTCKKTEEKGPKQSKILIIDHFS